jgi:hypothetical protein
MNKQIIGSIFLLMTTILYSTKYITAAIAGADNGTWVEEDFIRYLSYTPSIFNVFIFFTMLIGIIYFVGGIIDSKKE